jgi:hypothetical protein
MREASKAALWTASVLLGRKLIMHLAVDIAGAKPGETFVKYVEHLKAQHYIPPKSEKWLTLVKNLGNETNHEIKLATEDEATQVMKFVEILLAFMYEYADDPTAT